MSELQDKDSEFLKEAIADARTIKEVAVENAKDVLEEAFTTRLQSMISDRIQKEAEDEMGFDMGDEMEGEGENETDVSGEVEYALDDEGELEDLELDLGAEEEEEEIEVEPEMEPEGGEGEEMEPEPEGGEAPEGGGEDVDLDVDVSGDEEGEEQLEDDIDLEEVLRFLEGGDHEEEMKENYDEEQGSVPGEQDTGPNEYEPVNETGRTMRDSDIQEIINDLEEDIEAEADVDQQIEEFLDSLDNQVYEVDVNELQEQIERSSEGSDDVYEVDVDKLEEEYRDLNVDVGTEGHDMGDGYDEDFMDGYDPVNPGEVGMHQGDDDNEIYIDLDGPSSPDLNDPGYHFSDEGPSDYDQSGFDGHDDVTSGDMSNHGPDEPAPDAEENVGLGEGEISYEDLLQEIGEDIETETSRSDGSSNREVETLREENEELREKLKKHRQASKILRKRINEVNLINSKLLYTNRLFKRYNLNEDQKLRVIEALDRAKDKRGAKLVYSTLAEAFDSNVSRKDGNKKKALSEDDTSTKKSLSEALSKGMSSKNQGSQKPESDETKEKILNEDVEMRSRFQKLADIND